MPFENAGCRAFTWHSVKTNAPTASGVYGLSNSDRWIYVGESDDIQGELLKHLANPSSSADGTKPSGFTFELSGSVDRVSRQNALVLELAPISNRTFTGSAPPRH